MTIEILQNKREIKFAMGAFQRALVRASSKSVVGGIGYPGGSFEDSIYSFNKRTLWFCPADLGLNRYWNGFGSETPAEGRDVPIDVEINFPKTGINRTVAGAFARDSISSQVFVVHRGKIGGGRQGVSKTTFWEHFRGAKVIVNDGDRESEVALIGALDSSRLLAQVDLFVGEVRRIKKLVTSGDIEAGEKSQFREEFGGKKTYEMPDSVEASCDHGIVVNQLAENIVACGGEVANDRHRDLYVVGPGGGVHLLFEIKTDCSTTSLYSAVGQLMLHGRTGGMHAPLLIAVLPREDVTSEMQSRMEELGIETLAYSWEDKLRPVFPELEEILGRAAGAGAGGRRTSR